MRREQENFVTRRAMLPIAAAALTSAAVISTVANATENPDAALLDLVRRCIEAMDRLEAFQPILDAASDRYQRAPMPEAMHVREADPFPSYISKPEWRDGDHGEPQGPLCYEHSVAEKYLKTMLRAGKPAERQRAREILAAQEAWRAENGARWNSAGLDTATAENERLADIAHDLRHELCAMPARTLPGLLAKASVVHHCFEGSGESFAAYAAEELAQTGTASGEAVALSLVCDVVAMLPSAAHG